MGGGAGWEFVNGLTTCPGCGLRAHTGSGIPTGRLNASADCEAIYGEVIGFASEHLELLRLHQLTVDAYGAQHPGPPTKPIRLAYSLVGLHLALELGISLQNAFLHRPTRVRPYAGVDRLCALHLRLHRPASQRACPLPGRT